MIFNLFFVIIANIRIQTAHFSSFCELQTIIKMEHELQEKFLPPLIF